MNILFINNWNINNGLTVSTTFPSLKVLSSSSKIDNIIFVTPEYEVIENLDFEIEKVKHISIDLSMCSKSKLLKYICYENEQKKSLLKISQHYKIDKIIARGAQAGGRAYWLSKKLNIPFYVESFEPHSEYMLESGVWKKYDPRYIFQKKWENNIIKCANGIMPVAKNYKDYLNSKGVRKDKLATVPCTVDLDNFKFSIEDRDEIRKELNIDTNSICGIYVGKFGDIYYDDEAFEFFDSAFRLIDDFNLIILTPQNFDEIKNKLDKCKYIDLKRVHFKFVSHEEVPKYLSASDFAFEFHRAKPNTLYCSPIKVGEYWANGLAIIISNGVADDFKIIKKEKAGSIFDPKIKNYEECITNILEVLKLKDRNFFMDLASKYRNRNLISEAYEKLDLI